MSDCLRLKVPLAVFAISVAALALPAHADETLARRYNCVMCHELDKKFVGPGFQEVARKYQGQPEAAAMLYEKVRKGGSGSWGAVAMPPNRTVPAGDIRRLVDWVLKSG